MDMELNKYNHRKNVACACAILAALTANAYMVSYVQQLGDHIEYVDSITGVLAGALFCEIWSLGTVIASLCMHMEKKEHHKKLDMVATWTTMSMFNCFILNIVAAVLGHLSMMDLKEKLDGFAATSS